MFIGKVYVPLMYSRGGSVGGEPSLFEYVISGLLGLCCIAVGIVLFREALEEEDDIGVKLLFFSGSILMFVLGLCCVAVAL